MYFFSSVHVNGMAVPLKWCYEVLSVDSFKIDMKVGVVHVDVTSYMRVISYVIIISYF
jgi:hypothetical protein